jgi:dihydroorotate dehydrogenase (fumarate)
MADLTTTYLGLSLKNPLIASASPLSQKVESAKQLEEAGVSAIVMYSLFEEQIILDSMKLHADLNRGADEFAETLRYFPDTEKLKVGPEAYLSMIEKLKKAVSIPVIGSLNGFSTGGWIEYATKIEAAGADALELNLYFLATDINQTSSDLENEQIALVKEIRKRVRIPLAVKLSPFYTALPRFAQQLTEAGANGLVLFNRFYQPDFDLDTLSVTPNLVLSNSHELRLPLRWIAILYGKVTADFALTSGVHTAEDILKSIMAGAAVTMVASEFLDRGPAQARKMLSDLDLWMESHEYVSIKQMKGSMSQRAVENPAVFERANYMKVLSTY